MKLLGTDPTTPEGARKAVRYAGIGGLVSAALTLGVVVFVSLSGSGAFQFVSLWSLIDVGVLVALGIGTLRASRFAAGGLLAYYVLNQTVLRLSTGEVGSILLALLLVVLFVQGLRGALTLHRLEADQPLVDRIDAIADRAA